jgi:hypothetical protein
MPPHTIPESATAAGIDYYNRRAKQAPLTRWASSRPHKRAVRSHPDSRDHPRAGAVRSPRVRRSRRRTSDGRGAEPRTSRRYAPRRPPADPSAGCPLVPSLASASGRRPRASREIPRWLTQRAFSSPKRTCSWHRPPATSPESVRHQRGVANAELATAADDLRARSSSRALTTAIADESGHESMCGSDVFWSSRRG